MTANMASLRSVIVVDDEVGLAHGLARDLERRGCHVRSAYSLNEGRRLLEEQPSDVAFVECSLPDGEGADLVRWARPRGRIDTAYCLSTPRSRELVASALRAGCRDVLIKPLSEATVAALLANPSRELNIETWRTIFAPDIVGRHPQFIEQLCILRDTADTEATILISGESGTGKELFAKAIHQASPRHDRPFVAINCAAIPESLVEGELFGHVRGAFTGASSNRAGLIASANGGTLFLDEVGDMPLSAQAKLLRVLQERVLVPLGKDEPAELDIRVIAATNRDLETLVEQGHFRQDLLFRLNVINVLIPSLRDRPEDIFPLADFFLEQACAKNNRRVSGFEDDARRILIEHAWPGNVRELANVIERSVVLQRDGLISPRALQLKLKSRKRTSPPTEPTPVASPAAPLMSAPAWSATADGDDMNLRSVIEQVERRMISLALEKTRGNRTEAAALLGLNRTTLVEKLRKAASVEDET